MRRRVLGCSLALLLVGACAGPPPADEAALSETAGWLRDYLRLDTTNPPGREDAAAAFLAALLATEGIASETLDAGDGRASLWAYLPPTVAGPADVLLLLHHSDVVAAEGSWRHPPFAGDIAEGVLWGRGAIDSKGLGVAHLASLIALRRSGVERRRGVALFAAADEEVGGALGVGRWLERRPDLFAAVSVVVNEGGANRSYQGRLHWWGVEITQKRPLWLEATAADPAALVAGLRRLVDLPPVWRVPAATRDVLGALAPHFQERARRFLADPERYILPSGPTQFLLPGMESLFLDSVQVNEMAVLEDGRAQARIDLRLLPDSDAAGWLDQVRETLGAQIETTVLLEAPAAAPSPWTGPWVDILRSVLGDEGPVVPQVSAGITDSRYFRQRGVAAYGFSPFILDSEVTRGIHAFDERIPLDELERGARRMTALVAAWAGSAVD